MSALATRTRFRPHPVAIRTVEQSEHKQTLALKQNVECPVCGKVFVGGAVVNDEPEYVRNFGHSHYTGHIIRRRLLCDHDEILLSWYHATDREGTFLGAEIPGATGPYAILNDRTNPKDRTIDKFLREHPQAAGVAQ